MSTVIVTFKYDPEEPDDHKVGMSEDEFERLTNSVISLGGYDMEAKREADA